MGTLLHLRRIVPVDAPACGGAGCRQGDTPQACDCGIGAAAAPDMRRVASDNLRREIDGPYRKTRRPGLVERLINYVWSKA